MHKIKAMKIILNRNGTGKGINDIATIGELIVNNVRCYTLEDDFDEVKEYAHTRIPSGMYKLKLKTWGKPHEKYSRSFKGMHVGMLELQNVPNYKYILIHCGNTPENTAGCILVGSSKVNDSFISGSVDAYKKIYPMIADAIIDGEEVFINIID